MNIENKILKDLSIINNIKEMEKNKTTKNNKKKSININMDDNGNYIFNQFPLITRTKYPSLAYKKHKSGDLKGQFVSKDKWVNDIWKERNINYGTLTGKEAGFWVFDIDMYDKKEQRYLRHEEHPFFKDFPNFKWDTFTIKSPNKGFHVYYKWDDEFPMTSNTSEKTRCDTRGNGGYIVSPYSKLKTYDEKIREYEPINNLPINKCGRVLMEWIKQNILKKNIKKSINTKEIKNDDDDNDNEYDGCDLTQYNFNFTEEEIEIILKELDDKYFINYSDWLIFTTGMKTLWKAKEGTNKDKMYIVDLWDKYSKERGKWKYDYDKNNTIWDNINGHRNIKCIFKLINECSDKTKSLLKSYNIYKPVLNNRVKPDIIINREKLGYDFFNEYSFGKLRDCIIAKSDTGTGKTTSTKHFLEGKKFISIVSRISLGEEQYSIYNEHGLDCLFYEYIEDEYRGENIVIQIDSIGILGQGIYRGYFENYYVYIDEFNSLVEYLCRSPTLNKYRIRVFEQLINLINDCKGLIGTDADISDISLKLLQYTTKSPLYIKNEYKHNKGVESEEIIQYDEFMKKITKEKKFLCCCDSKTQAEIIYNNCKKAGMNDVILITSITNNYCRFDDFDRIIYSPKIIYGIDSVMRRPVYCFYKEQTISPNAMVQQIARCRSIKKLYYYFKRKTLNEYCFNNVDEAEQYLLKVDKEVHLLQYQKSCETTFKQFLELYSRFLYNEDCHNTNKFAHFLNLCQERGFIIDKKYKQEDKKKSKYMKDLEENEKLKIENFNPNTTSAQKLNEILKLPQDVMREYAEIFVDPWKAEYHFNLSDYLFKDNEEIKEDMDDLNDFSMEQIKHRTFKIDLLNTIRKKVFKNDNKLQLEMNPPNKKGIRGTEDKELDETTLNKAYDLFHHSKYNIKDEQMKKKGKKGNETNEKDDFNHTQQLIDDLAKSIFPEEAIINERRNIKLLDENGNVKRDKPNEKNKKGKILYGKESYYAFNKEVISRHKKLAYFRYNNGDRPDIEDYDDEVRNIINECYDNDIKSNIPEYCLI